MQGEEEIRFELSWLFCQGGMKLDSTGSSHKVQLENRRQCYLTGVTETISFDVREVWVVTTEGTVHIKGSELHVKRLSLEKGELLLEGLVESFAYTDNGGGHDKGKSLLKRMFG